MGYMGSVLKITGLLVALLLIAFLVVTYQPVRHVMYNNTKETVRVYQQHYGRTIAQSEASYINGFFETPLSNRIVFGDNRLSPRISFGANGEIKVYASTSAARTIQLPPAWGKSRIAWLEYRYQLNADGSIVLLDASSEPPTLNIDSQPDGFPIQLVKEPAVIHNK